MAKKAINKTAKKTIKKVASSRKKKKKSVSKKTKLPKALKKEVYFICMDGKPIKSLVELGKELDAMSDEVFYHHVTPDRNDFANWVNDILKEAQLAQDLGYVKDKQTACYTVMRHIVKKL